MKTLKMLAAGATVAAVAALTAAQPANALPVGNGDINFRASSGTFTVNDGHISLTTTSVNVPALAVTPNTITGNLPLVVSGNASLMFSGSAHSVPNTAIDFPVNFTVTISGLVFT